MKRKRFSVRLPLFFMYFSSGTTLAPSSGTRSSVLGSTCSIPSTCTAGKTICSGAGIPPIRSSPWRWPITPSRRAGSPVTSASPSDGCRPGGRGDLLDEPPRPACVDAPLAQRLGPHQRDAAIITPHRLVAQRASAVRERADVHARTSTVRVPAPAIFERCSTNRCRHVPSGSTCGQRLRTYATGSIAVPSPPHIPLACRAHQSECGPTAAARGRHQGGTQPMPPHETGSTTTPGDARATAPPPRTFGPQGPTLGDLSDAYLQDYQVRQFRSHSTARGRTAHLVAFFGRDARAATLTTYQIRQYQLTRRAAGAATGTINRETSALHRMCTLAVHWGLARHRARLPRPPPRESSPPGLLRAPRIPRRPRPPARPVAGTSSTSPTTPAGASRRSSASPGRRLTWPVASSGSRQPARRRWWDASSPSRRPSPRPWCGGGHAADPDSPLVFHRDGIPVRRWRTAWRTACQAAGVPTRFLHDCRRTAARNLIRANVPERVAMLLTGHKSRAIFDRYNIINEQELLDAGDQLVAYLAQQAQAAPAGRRLHPVGPAAPRTASPLRLVRRTTPPPRATHHPSASCDAPPHKGAWYAREPGGGGPDTACLCAAGRSRPNTVRAGQRSWHTWRRGGPTWPNTGTRPAQPSLKPGGRAPSAPAAAAQSASARHRCVWALIPCCFATFGTGR